MIPQLELDELCSEFQRLDADYQNSIIEIALGMRAAGSAGPCCVFSRVRELVRAYEAFSVVDDNSPDDASEENVPTRGKERRAKVM
jgi:hypothetical protein